jgi:hypothetical protein
MEKRRNLIGVGTIDYRFEDGTIISNPDSLTRSETGLFLE